MKKIMMFLTAGSLLLSGCSPLFTTTYLLKHPDALKRERVRCEHDLYRLPHCDLVKEVSFKLIELMVLRQQNPLEFGQALLKAEEKMALAQEKNATAPNTATEKAYEEAVLEVQFMLATIAAMGVVQ